MDGGWIEATGMSLLHIQQRRVAGLRVQQLFGRGARRNGTFSRGLFRRLRGIWR